MSPKVQDCPLTHVCSCRLITLGPIIRSSPISTRWFSGSSWQRIPAAHQQRRYCPPDPVSNSSSKVTLAPLSDTFGTRPPNGVRGTNGKLDKDWESRSVPQVSKIMRLSWSDNRCPTMPSSEHRCPLTHVLSCGTSTDDAGPMIVNCPMVTRKSSATLQEYPAAHQHKRYDPPEADM